MSDARTIAVVGASSNPERPSSGIFRKLLAVGYRVVPVNPGESVVQGQRAYASLAEVPGPIDIVDVFRRSEYTPEIADAAVAAGAKVLWLQAGIVNEEAAARAKKAGLTVVMDECIGVAHARLRIPHRPSAASP
ncbi:MAG TPA: CoA-binding protein [Polyangiaceae bacterium]|nr:CoA-binding protein [Polyangiaceae bacterium]